MAKNLFYKIISSVKEGYRTKILDIPQVEHNIDESLIVNINDFSFKRNTVNFSVFRRTYAYISKDMFFDVFANKLIFPTVVPSTWGEKYLGAAIVRCDKGDILTYLTLTTDDKVYLRPAVMFRNESIFNIYETTNILPKRNVKVFLTKEEYDADEDKKTQKRNENDKIDIELYEKVEKTTPIFSFKTPKFKIIEIVKKTAYLKDAKVGDIIYGEIPVIKESDNCKFGTLHGIGTRTNWVNLYVNDVKVNTISPKTFPMLFFINFIVEEI